jgi:hypothetical protein
MVMERWHFNNALCLLLLCFNFLMVLEHVPPSLASLNEHLMFGVRRLYAFQQALEYGAFTFQGYEI